jgi:hypothetical protein
VALLVMGQVPPFAAVLLRAETRSNWPTLPLAALAGLLFGAWLFFCAWSWRRVSGARHGEGAWIVWKNGVCRFGLSFWVVMTIIYATKEAGGFSATNVFSARMAGELAMQAIVMFPLALWCGYFWGIAMYGVFGRARQS